MGGLVRRVANYQNVTNALGYSFRYYASQMDNNERLRLLAINGVAPTVETIRNGSYPFTVDVYMVTTDKSSANTQALIDWFLSPQGQKLVEDVGYVTREARTSQLKDGVRGDLPEQEYFPLTCRVAITLQSVDSQRTGRPCKRNASWQIRRKAKP